MLIECQISIVKCQISNVNKVRRLSERASGKFFILSQTTETQFCNLFCLSCMRHCSDVATATAMLAISSTQGAKVNKRKRDICLCFSDNLHNNDGQRHIFSFRKCWDKGRGWCSIGGKSTWDNFFNLDYLVLTVMVIHGHWSCLHWSNIDDLFPFFNCCLGAGGTDTKKTLPLK